MLRKLEEKDARYMLEWMHDEDINQFFRFDAANMTYEDAIKYIENVNLKEDEVHYAIVDDNDEYLGTISLKHVDYENKKAEYAISTRKKAHGTGVAMKATYEIFRIAFEELGLNKVYLNVLSVNKRANKFYEKAGFEYEGEFKQDLQIRGHYYDLRWYGMLASTYEINKKNIEVME